MLDEETIKCPVCNNDITEFISSALTVGIAETDITAEIADLKAELLTIDRKIALKAPKLDALRQQVNKIEEQRENIKITRAIIVWSDELKLAKQNFTETQLKISTYEIEIKGLLSKSRVYSKRKMFADTSYRTSFAELLDATNINTDGIDIQSLSLYDLLNLSGSEIPRVAISRFFALLESKSENSITMPIIFDFPNLDMTEENLKKCFKVICDKIFDIGSYPQSFVFSIDCEERIAKSGSSLQNAHIIRMESLPMDDRDKPQFLCEKDYLENIEEINQMINI